MRWHLRNELADIPIEIHGVHARQVGNRFFLTASIVRNYTIDGMIFSPEIRLTDTASGYLMYSQFCLHHRLSIQTERETYLFSTKGDRLLDRPSEGTSHINWYIIRNNLIQSPDGRLTQPICSDCPYM